MGQLETKGKEGMWARLQCWMSVEDLDRRQSLLEAWSDLLLNEISSYLYDKIRGETQQIRLLTQDRDPRPKQSANTTKVQLW